MHRPHRANLSEVPSVSRPSRVERCYLNLICWKSPFSRAGHEESSLSSQLVSLQKDKFCKRHMGPPSFTRPPPQRAGSRLLHHLPVTLPSIETISTQRVSSHSAFHPPKGPRESHSSTLPTLHLTPVFSGVFSTRLPILSYWTGRPGRIPKVDLIWTVRSISDSMRSHILAYNIQFLWIKLFYSWDSNSSQYFYI